VLIKVVNPFTAGIVHIGLQTGTIAQTIVKNFLEKASVTAYHGQLRITGTFAGRGGLTVRLISAAGAVVKAFRFVSVPQGEQTFTLSAKNVPQGVCFALLSTGDCRVIKKIVMTR
jgi:hypothetical protein